MKDKAKTKAQLIAELEDLRRKVAQYETEKQILPSEERYRTLFEDAPVALWEEDFSETRAILEYFRRQGVSDFHAYLTQYPDVMAACMSKFKVINVNQATLDLFGASNLSTLIEGLPDTFTDKSVQTFQRALVFLAEGRLQFEEEAVLRTLDGDLRHVLLRSFASPDDLAFSHIIVAMIDITKQKRIEEQLRESEEKFRSFIEQSHDGMRLVNAEGRILVWNQSLECMTGLKQAEVLGQFIWDVVFALTPEEKRSPAVYERIKALCIEVCTIGNTSWLSPGIEYEIQRPDGARRFFQTTLFPINTDSKIMVGSIIRDVTELKQAEQNLYESEEKFRLIAENTSDGILVIEHDRIVYTSPAYNRMMEIAEHEQDGLGAAEIAALIHPDDREHVFADIYAAITQQRSDLRYTYRTVTGTGKPIWREDHARFIYAQDGRHQKSYVVCRDITAQIRRQEEARQREQQIQRANKLASLGVLVSGIAHEINNPNNFISLNISTLREYLAELFLFVDAHEPYREFLGLTYPEFRQDLLDLVDDMEYGSQRISQIVSDLRDYSQQRSEKQWEWINVQKVIEKATNLCLGKIRKTVASFDAEFPDDLEQIYTDQHALEQIIINLLINAAQAMDKADSRIRVRVAAHTPQPNQLQIEIRDNGCGIEQESLDKIFDPFYTTKPLGEGVGLGLYICHNLLTGIGGKLEVESSVSLGSTFRIILNMAGPRGEL